LTALRAFNRKERFLLVQWALDRPGFALGGGFRNKLEQACGLDLSGEAVVAMDYHLDWLYAALMWASDPSIQPGLQVARPAGRQTVTRLGSSRARRRTWTYSWRLRGRRAPLA
jgi:hypothetical protein